MEFKKEDLLTYDDIEKYLSSGEPTDRSKIICNKLKNYVFINNGVLFVFDIKTILYKRHEGGVEAIKNRILYIISAYLTSSKKGLEQRDYDLLKSIHTKHFVNMSENAKIGQTMSEIIIDLTNDEKKILGNDYEIHFLNGYLDMKTNEFKERILGVHFVVDAINREYKKSKKAHREELKAKLKLIYPINEDFKTILYILGSAMTGKATKEQKILFLLGKGSAGKSSIMQITKSAVECYFDELGSDAFSMSNKHKDKTFSTFYNRPFVRIIWINEPKTDKMEKSTFKSFCEGQMKGTLLFKDKEHDFGHNALPIFTANEMPNIDVDDGVKRRIRGYEHLSKFTDDTNALDTSQNIY
jgi:phage/plasmid-associated DNA primase